MEAAQYIEEIARRRGSVSTFHKVMAKHDFDVLRATDDLTKAIALRERTLDPATKELLFVMCLVAVRGDRQDVAMHVRGALRAGVSPAGVLEALELLIPLAGVPAFKEGLDVWIEVTEAEGLEPVARSA